MPVTFRNSLNQRSLTSSQLAVAAHRLCLLVTVLAHMALLRNLNLMPTLKNQATLHTKTQISSFSSQVEDRVPLMPHLQTRKRCGRNRTVAAHFWTECLWPSFSPPSLFYSECITHAGHRRHLMSDPWFKRKG